MKIISAVFIALFVFSCQPKEESNIGLVASNAMVVSGHPVASQVGLEIIKKGGNAVDAAIAVQFALAVVLPRAGNIGGGGFMVYRSTLGETYSLDFREAAPGKATRDMYIGEKGLVMEGLSTRGHLASGVPGVVDGMIKAYEQFGSLEWSELIEPSVKLAREGHKLTKKEAGGLNNNQEDFIKYNSVEPSAVLKDEWAEGDVIIHEDLANTLSRIKDNGREGFYSGETARLIVAEMERGKGWITLEDLENYSAKWREPIIGEYREYKVISMGPPSSGGIALIQLLNNMESHDLATMKFHSAPTIHLMVESERRVYADRAAHLGDPDYYDVPITMLADLEYNQYRMSDFDPTKATLSDDIREGTTMSESEETTHFSIIDTEGNAVSITTTINGGYGSKVFVSGAGFLLNNEMDDFSIKPGHPNMFGLVGGEANAIEPQKRMLSSMTPTIIEKNDKLFMVVGTPGGATIITSVFQTIVNVIDFNMGMQEAVNAQRFHHQWKPDRIIYERNGIDSLVIEELTSMGHSFYGRRGIGRVDAILVLPDGTLEGGAETRGDDAAS